MNTNKDTITEPELFVDDHHGQYMGKIAYEQLADEYKVQAQKALSTETIADLLNMESEFHHDAVDEFTRVEFVRPSGQKFNIQFAEGGMWIIPYCFMRSKAAADFFG
jgi:hypothetical protein